MVDPTTHCCKKMGRSQRNMLWALTALLVLLVVNHYLYFLKLFSQPVGEPGTVCSSFRSAREILLDDVCFPPVFSSSSSRQISANVARDVEAFRTTNWQSPTDCINGKEFWGGIRNSPAVIKSFDRTTVWKQFPNTYFQGPDVSSVSHRCSGEERPWYLSWILPTVYSKTFKSAYLVASQYWGQEFFHAIHEKGFMLGAARALLTQNPDMAIVVEALPPKLAEFAQEILGIPRARFHVMFFAVLVEKLYVPYGADCATQSAQHTLLTREWIRDRHPTLYKAPPLLTDITIIHRNEAGTCNRCLKNSEELRDAFRKYYPLRAVHLVVLGELPYAQVIKLLAKTDMLIAPHGAGLVNMILLPDGAKVLEILNKQDNCNFCFYELSLGLGLQYKAVSPLKTGPSTVDFTRVDVDHVLAAAEEMMRAQELS